MHRQDRFDIVTNLIRRYFLFKLRDILLLLLASVAVLAIGCGGDEDESAAKGPPLSKAEFVQSANEICARGQRESQRWLDDYTKRTPQDQPQAEFNSDVIKEGFLPTVRKVNDRIEELSPPDGDEDQIEAFLGANREAVETAEEKDVSAELEVDPAFKEPGKLARDYGISECAYR
jgi:hypothetical protein